MGIHGIYGNQQLLINGWESKPFFISSHFAIIFLKTMPFATREAVTML